jgi:hypothetical protein
MANSHNLSFFDRSVGIIFDSPSRSDLFIFVKCSKRKEDNSWEKFSQGEGKVVKLDVGELALISQVLDKKSLSWSTEHVYHGRVSYLFFGWITNSFVIQIDVYVKKVPSEEVETLRELVAHLLKEKTSNAWVTESLTKKDILLKLHTSSEWLAQKVLMLYKSRKYDLDDAEVLDAYHGYIENGVRLEGKLLRDVRRLMEKYMPVIMELLTKAGTPQGVEITKISSDELSY